MSARSPVLEKASRPLAGRDGPRAPGPMDPGGGGGASGDASSGAPPAGAAAIMVWLLVGAIVILFASFTSTLLVRRGEPDWHVGPLPTILWVNTAVLLASSTILEWARRRHDGRGTARGVAVAFLLGVAFLAGQIIAWRQLVAAGVGMASGPHAGFFYLLTGTHGLHVAAGVVVLAYTAWKVRRELASADATARRMALVKPVAIYWHFVDVLWLYVLVVLFWA